MGSTIGSAVGQIEKMTQQRVVRLFREQLGSDSLGDWTEREGNRNIEEDLLGAFLCEKQGYDESLIMRALHSLDKAAESEKISAFDDLSLVQLIVERGAAGVEALPERIKKNKEAVAEAIENNIRRLIIDEQPINPKYYEKMSALLGHAEWTY